MLISKNRVVSIVDCVGISVKADACAAIVDDNIYAGPADWEETSTKMILGIIETKYRYLISLIKSKGVDGSSCLGCLDPQAMIK